MTAFVLTLAAALSVTADDLPLAPERASAWELGAAAGGGWDSNPLAASAPVSSGFATARGWVARRLEPTETDDVWLQLHYDGARYANASAVDLDRPELSLEWAHAFGGGVVTRAILRGALRFQGDADRSGWDAGARVVLRLPLRGPLALRLGAAVVHRDAREAAYAWSSGRLEAGIDATPWRGAMGGVRYLLDVGTDTFYATPVGGSGGYRGMGSSDALDGSVREASRVAHGVTADLLQLLGRGLFVQASYGITLERGAESSYVAHAVVTELGWQR